MGSVLSEDEDKFEVFNTQKTNGNSALWIQIALGFAVLTTNTFNYILGKIRSEALFTFDYLATILNTLAYVLVYSLYLLYGIRTGRVTVEHLRALRVMPRLPIISGNDEETETTKLLISTKLEVNCTSRARSPFCMHVMKCKFKSFQRRIVNWGYWKYFFFTGILDALGNVTAFVAYPHVSGSTYVIANQGIIFFTVLFSFFLLKKRYSLLQILGVSIVAAGAVICILSHSHSAKAVPEFNSSIFYAILILVSTIPTAISFILKEYVVRHYKQITGTPFPFEILLWSGSSIQCLFTPFLAPIMALVGQTHNQSLWTYLSDGLLCFRGQNTLGCTSCKYAAAAYGVYICTNILFNTCLTALLSVSSALFAFLMVKGSVPTSIILFTLVQWPLIPIVDQKLTLFLWTGFAMVLLGLGIYLIETYLNTKRFLLTQGQPSCFWPMQEWFSSFFFSAQHSLNQDGLS